MECPICYDVITSQTGIVTTSCGHSYHFTCISSWFMTQEENSTCPCCRKVMGAIEDLPYTEGDIEDEEDSDDSDDDEEDEDEEDEVEFNREQLDTFLRNHGGFGITDAMAESICPTSAAFTHSELRILCMGNGARQLSDREWGTLLYPQLQVNTLLENGTWVHNALNPEEVVLEVTCDVDTANTAASKVQAVWRGFKSRHTMRA